MEKNELPKKETSVLKNININIKSLRKTKRMLIENPSTREPGKKTLHSIFLTLNR